MIDNLLSLPKTSSLRMQALISVSTEPFLLNVIVDVNKRVMGNCACR